MRKVSDFRGTCRALSLLLGAWLLLWASLARATPAERVLDDGLHRASSVIFHRPGAEIGVLTPQNLPHFLYGRFVSAEKMAAAHDELTTAFRDHGTQVLYVKQLLTNALHDPAAREGLLRELVPESTFGRLAAPIREHLTEVGGQNPALLASWAIEGMPPTALPHELQEGLLRHAGPGLRSRMGYVLLPLPNLVYTRDSFTVVNDHVLIFPMRYGVRKPEASIMNTIFRHAPELSSFHDKVIDLRRYPGVSVEGGDISRRADQRQQSPEALSLVVGRGPRTNTAGINAMLTELSRVGILDRALVIDLPHEPSTFHLDLSLSPTGPDTISLYERAVAEEWPAHFVWMRGTEPVWKRAERGLLHAYSAIAGTKIRALVPPMSENHREQALGLAHNGVVLDPSNPDAMFLTHRNPVTNKVVRAGGVGVVELHRDEIQKGNGGDHCSSNEIHKAPPKRAPVVARPVVTVRR